MTFISSTVSGNSSTEGGGVFRNSGNLVFQNTIVANSPSGGNCSGVVTSQNFNLSDDGTCNFNQPDDLINTPAKLTPLGNFGGSTQTHHPLSGSAAIDSADCVIPVDQRGAARPQGPDCDRGSVEALTPVALQTLCVSLFTGGVASPPSGQCGAGQWQLTLPSLFPLNFCVNSYSGQLSFAFSGACASPRTLHVIPDDGPLAVCWSRYSGKLRVVTDVAWCTFGVETPALIGSLR
jgi:hypothetical protein